MQAPLSQNWAKYPHNKEIGCNALLTRYLFIYDLNLSFWATLLSSILKLKLAY